MEMKNVLEVLSSRFMLTEDIINNPEDRSIRITQSEDEKEKEGININRAPEICRIPSTIQKCAQCDSLKVRGEIKEQI